MTDVAYLSLQASRHGQGSYAHVHEVVRELRQRGWRVRLYAPDPQEHRAPRGLLRRIPSFLSTQARLVAGSGSSKLLYVRNHVASFPTSLWARLRRIPMIHEVNGSYADWFIAWPVLRRAAPIIRWLLRVQFRWADYLITVTDELEAWLVEEAGHQRILVLPNAADPDRFRPGLPPSDLVSGPYALFFGAFTEWHNLPTLLRATFDESWPKDLPLVFAGDGPGRPQIEAARRDGAAVTCVGRITYDEIPHVVANSEMTLCIATARGGRRSAGSPLKLYESLACAVPVICADVPGQGELVKEHVCGIAVCPDSPAAIAAAVRKLHADAVLRREMGTRGRELVVHQHSWAVRVAELDRVMRSLTSTFE